ncbi:dephospho-CoA kinase [Algoriphagus faecimaris]|uniref:Dephospho-CoA kinase n=1 Tax=Algoriphagus faecimaris TaxID=686796 RepID=A0A1G6R2B8_9BACT|nr:dephospho-CoA kinase [Algoriphagus faecimaris]SDC98698.1 dephospho-CoA kinase [Algoriphagus faecimaris]
MNSAKRIGLTGGIGSGKSTVAKIFEILGIPVYYADDRAKKLMNESLEIRAKIQENFGEETYDEKGQLNREFLAKTIFSDPEKVKIINSIVHPVVGKDFEEWADQQSSPYVLKEAALIFESESHEKLDAVITVSSPIKIRINRILMRDPHRSSDQINQIIDQQLPDEIKNEKADYVIKNKDNVMLIPQVLSLHQKLSS